ncbi:MAG: gene transfer agent family protein [Magnetospirillum sp.]|nr:gene transfer agent family protein [Magnetospirillum sp.]
MNKHRGDVAVTLGGREYVLRPTFGALVEIEERLGMGLVPLARKVLEGQFGFKEVATIIACGIKGAGERVPGNLGDLTVEAGLMQLSEPVARFLNGALAGDAEGNG